MAVNKVVFGNTTVMDITDSTVDSDTLLTGTKAYGANGDPVIGGVVKSWTGTAAQYAQEASQIPDGTQVNILDDFTPVGVPIGIADIYSTEEREIGVWIDGKPLYEKTYEITTPSTAATPTAVIEYPSTFAIKVIDGLYNNANPINVYRGANYYTATFNNKTNHTIDVETKGISVGVSGVIILKYTKSTDAPGSGKYAPGGNYAIHYSTDEQVIGTWINGETLYRKTVSCGALPANTSKNTPHNVSNIDKIVGIRGVGIRTNESNYVSIPLPHAHYANVANQEEISVNKTNITIRNGNSSANTFDASYVTIEYTKTTD